MPVRVFGLHGASNTTGRSAKPCKSARPHRHRGVGRCTPSTLESAVELRLGEKRAGRLEDVIGRAQFLDLTLQRFNALTLVGAKAIPGSCVDLLLLDPVVERLRHAADLGCNGFNTSSQRWVFPPMLLHHPNSAFTHLW